MTVKYASGQTDPCLLLPTETLIAVDYLLTVKIEVRICADVLSGLDLQCLHKT